MDQNNNYQGNNNIDLNDPMVQKCMAYLMNTMSNNQQYNGQMNPQMNPQMNLQMNPQMNQMQMNQIQMQMKYNWFCNQMAQLGVAANPMQMQSLFNMFCNQQNNNNAFNFANNTNQMGPFNNVGGNYQNFNNVNNINNNNNFFNNSNNNFNNSNNNNFNNTNNFNNSNNNNFNNSNNNNFNNINNNNNFNNNNNNNNFNNNGQINPNPKHYTKLPELLPREDKTIYEKKIPPNTKNVINIALNASSGLKVIIPISEDSSIEELLQRYAAKVGLPESVLGTKIIFLFNGGKLDVHSKERLSNHFKNSAVITVFDQGGIIGA